jgi:hypothetical protein
MCKIIHELCPNISIGVQGLVNGKPYDTIGLYCYPDDDGYWGEQEVSNVIINQDERLKVVSVTLSVDIDSSIIIDKTKCKKEKKMNEELVKLSSVLGLINEERCESINLCIMLKTGRYVYLHSEADVLLGLDIIQDCFVDEICTIDPDTEEEGTLYIRASKKEENEND